MVAITVDYRGSHFGGEYRQALDISDALERVGGLAHWLNVNQPLDRFRSEAPDLPILCLAQAFAPGSANARRYPGPFGVRMAIADSSRSLIGSGLGAFLRSSSADKLAARETMRGKVALPPGFAVRVAGRHSSLARRVREQLGFPVVLKNSANTGASVGVLAARTVDELRAGVEEHFATEQVPLLIEQHLPGREFTCWVLDEGAGPQVYGLLEVRRSPGALVFTQADKMLASFGSRGTKGPSYLTKPRLPASQLARLRRTAVEAHAAVGLGHFSRVDLIMSGTTPNVIDINASPHLRSGTLGTVARARGESFGKALLRILAAEPLGGQ